MPAGVTQRVKDLGSDSSGAAILTATRVKLVLNGNCKMLPHNVAYTFRTIGITKGSIDGTFSAHGKATITQEFGWTFDESFTIKSGAHQIAGTISAMGSRSVGPHASCHPPGITGPFVVNSSTKSGNGKARIDVVKADDFRE